MTTSHSALGLLLAAAVLTAGCGKQERIEGARFAKTIAQKKAAFTSANTLERELVDNARIWCAAIVANGAGKGADLDKNAALAASFSKAAVSASAKLSEVRQAIDDQPLQEEFPRTVRAEMTTQLTKRQRTLQDIRALLDVAGPQFLEYKKSKDYKGDSYPEGIAKLNALIASYKVPEDAVGQALTSLQEKYSLKPDEM